MYTDVSTKYNLMTLQFLALERLVKIFFEQGIEQRLEILTSNLQRAVQQLASKKTARPSNSQPP